MSDEKSKRSAVYDVMAGAGLLVLAFGCWLAWAPLGFIVPGALLVAGGIAGAKRT